MISGRWDYLLPKDRNGVIFINLDPALMKPILDKLRYRSNCGPNEQMMPRISIDRRAIFDNVVSYYSIGDKIYGDVRLSEESRIECKNERNGSTFLGSFMHSILDSSERAVSP